LQDTKKHTITFSADPAATVAVAGTFNNWEPTPMKFNEKKGGVFTCKVPVKAGSSIEYKFVVNGNWVCDESAPTTNNNGNINNVFTL
jgi:1,4-alpha-glucan branching enzyme